ncbi:MAG: hypothetical protein QXD94_04180 [Sulfolobales archaeon]
MGESTFTALYEPRAPTPPLSIACHWRQAGATERAFPGCVPRIYEFYSYSVF